MYEKLSAKVNRASGRLLKIMILGLCLFAGFIIIAVTQYATVKTNNDNVKLYTSQIDANISEKMAFIGTIANGAVSIEDYYSYVDSMVSQYSDVSAVYVCVKEDEVIYADGIMTYMSGGWIPPEGFVVSERAWYKGAKETNGVFVSEPYVDEQTGNICVTLSKTITRNGEVLGVAGLDMYMDDLVSIMKSSYSGNNYAFLTTKDGTILTHPNEDLALTTKKSANVNDALNGKYKKVCEDVLRSHLIIDYKGGIKFAVNDKSEKTGWNVVAITSFNWIIFLAVGIIIFSLLLGEGLARLSKKLLKKKSIRFSCHLKIFPQTSVTFQKAICLMNL